MQYVKDLLTEPKEQPLLNSILNDIDMERLKNIEKIFLDAAKEELYYKTLNDRERKEYDKNYWIRQSKDCVGYGLITEQKHKENIKMFRELFV